jgi:parvulin-like peptidyl-prolyl isomerase
MPIIISTEDIIRQVKISCNIPDVLQGIARERIIKKTSEQLSITVTTEELQKEGDSVRLANKLVKAKDTWAWLEKHHLSLDEFEELVHFQVLSRKLAHHLFAGQVEKVFYENQINFNAAITHEVLLEDRDLALELFFALKEGEVTFPEIARQYIQDPELRRMGGYQGVRRRMDFRPEVAAAVFAAKPPQILKPITTPKGVYLIWVEEIIQPQLDEIVRSQIIQDLFNGWLQQQIVAETIQVQLDNTNSSNSSLINSA